MKYIIMMLAIVAWANPLWASDIVIDAPFSRPARMSVGTGAAYMQITNTHDTDVALIAAQSPIATRVEIHEIISDDTTGRLKMVEIPKLVIPAGQSVTLRPGGYHLMLMGLQQSLADGESFPLTITFDNGDERTLTIPVAMPR
jgi:copper(I)-binding protein